MRRVFVLILLSLLLVATGVQVAALRLNEQLCSPAAVICDISLEEDALLVELLGCRCTLGLPDIDPHTAESAQALGEACISFIERAGDRLSETAGAVRRVIDERLGDGQGTEEKTGQ